MTTLLPKTRQLRLATPSFAHERRECPRIHVLDNGTDMVFVTIDTAQILGLAQALLPVDKTLSSGTAIIVQAREGGKNCDATP